MRWIRVTATVFAILCSGRMAAGQAPTGRVAGVVTEEGTTSPLPSVSVIVVGTKIGVLTGADGRFLIPGMPAGTHTLRAMALGYANTDVQVTVTAGQTASASFRLEPQAVKLNEVVAIGYGSTRK
ncbi:MAG TPA: carboxypeptidase-like regulatory domain-containing protein, partial [Longimicrobiales bacterium]